MLGRNCCRFDRLAVGTSDRDPGGVQRAGDLRERVVLVEHVRGVEPGHLRGDRGRPPRCWSRLWSAGWICCAMFGDPVEAHLERQQQVLLRRLDLVGNAQALRPCSAGSGPRGAPRRAGLQVGGVARPLPLESTVKNCCPSWSRSASATRRCRCSRAGAVGLAHLAAVDADDDQDHHDDQRPRRRRGGPGSPARRTGRVGPRAWTRPAARRRRRPPRGARRRSGRAALLGSPPPRRRTTSCSLLAGSAGRSV